MANLKRWRDGQPIDLSAGTWNRFCDATEWIEKQGMIGSGAAGRPDILTAELLIRVKNISGSDVSRFGVLTIDGALFDAQDDDARPGFFATPLVNGIAPTTANWGKFVVAVEPIANGRIGNAVVAGIVPCQVNIFVAGHLWADVKSGDLTQLNSDDCGNAKILTPVAGTGVKWVYLLLGASSTTGFCVAQEDLTANVPGSFKFASRSGSVYGDPTEMTWMAGEDSGVIEAGDLCFRTRIGSEWIASPVDCPEEDD